MDTADPPPPHRSPHPRWNPGGELAPSLQVAAEVLERNGLRPVGSCQLSAMTRPQRAALGALLGCGMVRPQVLLDLQVLDTIFRAKYRLDGGLVQACEIALGRQLVADPAG
jgi:hypothetical protein